MPSMQINRKVLLFGLGSFVLFLYLSTWTHEIGHSVICELSGYHSKIIVEPLTLETRESICSGFPENAMLHNASGGIFGLGLSGGMLAAFRKNTYVIIGAVPQVIVNALTGIMETFANNWYIHDAGMAPMAIASLPMMAAFLYLLFWKAHRPTPSIHDTA